MCKPECKDINIIEEYLGVHWRIESPSGVPTVVYYRNGLRCYRAGDNIVLLMNLHKRIRDVRNNDRARHTKYHKVVERCKEMETHHWSKWRIFKGRQKWFQPRPTTPSLKVAHVQCHTSLNDPNCKEKFWEFVKLVEELYK